MTTIVEIFEDGQPIGTEQYDQEPADLAALWEDTTLWTLDKIEDGVFHMSRDGSQIIIRRPTVDRVV